MPAKFEDLIAEMEENGVDPAFIEKAKEAFAASPLRAELRDAKAAEAAAIERAQRAETASLRSSFEKLGIKAKPEAFRFPDDLDRTDHESVQSWAVENGLADPPAPLVSANDLDALDRVAAASTGAGQSTGADPTLAALAATSEAEFWAAAQAAGATS